MSEKQSLPQGVLLSGICKGVRTEMFNNNTNSYIGIDIQTTDRYGQSTSQTEEVSVFGDNAQSLINRAQENIGKHIVIPVIKRSMKSDRTGNAYMRTTISRNSQIYVLN